MNKGVVWGVVIVVVLIVAGLMAWRSAGPNGEPVPTGTGLSATFSPIPSTLPFTSLTPAPSAGSSEATGSTVALTDTGFSPQTLTVAAGTTVTFVNNGQAPHWPASDLHPTHRLLPGFDALKGLATGETFSFTFTKVGSWACHDHLNPQLRCTIVVE